MPSPEVVDTTAADETTVVAFTYAMLTRTSSSSAPAPKFAGVSLALDSYESSRFSRTTPLPAAHFPVDRVAASVLMTRISFIFDLGLDFPNRLPPLLDEGAAACVCFLAAIARRNAHVYLSSGARVDATSPRRAATAPVIRVSLRDT